MKKFLKGLMLGLGSIILLATVFATYKAESQNTNQRIFDGIMVTSGGTSGGELIAWLNTGGNNYISGYATIDSLSGYITGYTEIDPVRSAVSGNYFPLVGNDTTNPITGPMYMENGGGSYQVAIETGTIMFSNMTLQYTGPVSRPMFDVQGVGQFPSIVYKGFTTYQGEEGENTTMYFVNSTGDRGAGLELDDGGERFEIGLNSGGLDQNYIKWVFKNNGTIQAKGDDLDIASAISDDNDFITKGYADERYFPRTSVDTGFNNIGSDIIIPSEKAIRGLFDGLTTNYIPLWSGDELVDSPILYSGDDLTIEADDVLYTSGARFHTTWEGGGEYYSFYGGDTRFNGLKEIREADEHIIRSRATVDGSGGILQIGDGIAGIGMDKSYIGMRSSNSYIKGIYIRSTDTPVYIGYYLGSSVIKDTQEIYMGASIGIEVDSPNLTLTGNTNLEFINPTTTGLDFRMAWSGGLMEAQYYTGGAWTTATIFTL